MKEEYGFVILHIHGNCRFPVYWQDKETNAFLGLCRLYNPCWALYMTILLRIFSLLIFFVGTTCFITMGIGIYASGLKSIRDILAVIAFFVLGILSIRCGRWLWRRRRFWKEKTALTEVITLAVALLFCPVVLYFEVRLSGAPKDAAHLLYVFLVVTTYILAKRYVPVARSEVDAGAP